MYGHIRINHLNIVKDFDMLQGYRDFGRVSLRNSIDVKRVRIGNNSNDEVYVAINDSYDIEPKPQFKLEPKVAMNLGLNMPGDYPQFVLF